MLTCKIFAIKWIRIVTRDMFSTKNLYGLLDCYGGGFPGNVTIA